MQEAVQARPPIDPGQTDLPSPAYLGGRIDAGPQGRRRAQAPPAGAPQCAAAHGAPVDAGLDFTRERVGACPQEDGRVLRGRPPPRRASPCVVCFCDAESEGSWINRSFARQRGRRTKIGRPMNRLLSVKQRQAQQPGSGTDRTRASKWAGGIDSRCLLGYRTRPTTRNPRTQESETLRGARRACVCCSLSSVKQRPPTAEGIWTTSKPACATFAPLSEPPPCLRLRCLGTWSKEDPPFARDQIIRSDSDSLGGVYVGKSHI